MNIFWYTVDSAYFPLRLNSRSQFLFLVVFNNFFFIFCLIIWHLLNLSKQRRSLVAYPVDGASFEDPLFSTPLYLHTLYLHTLGWQKKTVLFAGCIVSPYLICIDIQIRALRKWKTPPLHDTAYLLENRKGFPSCSVMKDLPE